MAELSTTEKINITMKMIFGIQGLSNRDPVAGLRWFEEQYAWKPFILNDEIYADAIPTAADAAAADVVVAANPTLLERRDIKMSLVGGTNSLGLAAYQTYNDPNSGLYDDWLLPQLFGQGYSVGLYEDTGGGAIDLSKKITTTMGSWVPVYKLGLIVMGAGYSPVDEGYTLPLWARAYRYIGDMGISGSSAHVSLDDAYNEGDTITVDDGPVVLNASATYAPLQLTPIAYTPAGSLAAGQLCINSGVLYAYDSGRSKWLSVDQPVASYQIRNGDGNYLATGSHADSKAGFLALRDCTVVGIAANGGAGLQTKSFAIRKDGLVADIATFSLVAGEYKTTATDLDFSAGEVIQVYCSATGTPIKNPRVNLMIAWRI